MTEKEDNLTFSLNFATEEIFSTENLALVSYRCYNRLKREGRRLRFEIGGIVLNVKPDLEYADDQIGIDRAARQSAKLPSLYPLMPKPLISAKAWLPNRPPPTARIIHLEVHRAVSMLHWLRLRRSLYEFEVERNFRLQFVDQVFTTNQTVGLVLSGSHWGFRVTRIEEDDDGCEHLLDRGVVGKNTKFSLAAATGEGNFWLRRPPSVDVISINQQKLQPLKFTATTKGTPYSNLAHVSTDLYEAIRNCTDADVPRIRVANCVFNIAPCSNVADWEVGFPVINIETDEATDACGLEPNILAEIWRSSARLKTAETIVLEFEGPQIPGRDLKNHCRHFVDQILATNQRLTIRVGGADLRCRVLSLFESNKVAEHQDLNCALVKDTTQFRCDASECGGEGEV